MVALGLVATGLVLILWQILSPWHAHGAEHGAHGGGHPRLFMSLHLALLVTLPMALGGVFFVAFNHLSGSKWVITSRRLAENYFWFLPIVLVVMAIIFFGGGMDTVFHHWVHASESDKILAGKKPWLNAPFFIGRNLLWVVVWTIFGFFFWKLSSAQDIDGKFNHNRTMVKLSPVFLVIFGLTYSFTAWDLGMSIEPHWFSTMWAIYAFAGLALTFYSSMILWIWYLKRAGYYGDSLNENHVHDFGKYLWGHTIFWAYIGFSQFMLIWYAHLPEETVFYFKRIYNPDQTVSAWYYVGVALVLIRFILPLFLIIRRDAKRNLNWLAAVAGLHFIGQIVDSYWLIYPTLDEGHFIMLNPIDLGPLLLMLGLFLFTVGMGLSRSKLIPVKEPRLEDCLHWHQ